MRKLFFIAVFVLGLATTVAAQTNDRAIGLRFGYGAELSYQHPLSGNTRLEADLGLYGYGDRGAFVFSGIHQWVMNIDGGLDWYAGVGAQLGTRWYEKDNTWNSGFGLAVAGQIGLEYNFPVPLQLSLDYRPAFYFIPAVGGAWDYVALSVRYRF
ncbi:MAG: hypothetical protein GX102_03915 [Porphyromonadaceae bacterium]|nr:hypothetical protein [Porphyromonadaceae bacterium]